MSGEIEATIAEYLLYLNQRCPVLCPSIFPTYYNLHSLEQLCTKSKQHQIIRNWTNENNFEFPEFSFSSVLNFDKREIIIKSIMNTSDVDNTLYSVEKLMKLITIGDQNEINVHLLRFLEVNHYDNMDEANNIRLFYEVIHLAYSLKVLISNVPGIAIKLGDYSLPLPEGVDIEQVLNESLAHDIAIDHNHHNGGDEDDEDLMMSHINKKLKKLTQVEEEKEMMTSSSGKQQQHHQQQLKDMSNNINNVMKKKNKRKRSKA